MVLKKEVFTHIQTETHFEATIFPNPACKSSSNARLRAPRTGAPDVFGRWDPDSELQALQRSLQHLGTSALGGASVGWARDGFAGPFGLPLLGPVERISSF